jgi:hypothetical protein
MSITNLKSYKVEVPNEILGTFNFESEKSLEIRPKSKKNDFGDFKKIYVFPIGYKS